MKALTAFALISSCTTLPYRGYLLDLSRVSQEQSAKIVMYAQGEYEDLTGIECWHPERTAGRCAVMESGELRAFISDYVEVKVRRISCERGDPSGINFDFRYYGMDMSAMTDAEARLITMQAIRKQDQNISGAECLTAVGAAPVCDWVPDLLDAATEHEANQKRLERCEKDSLTLGQSLVE